MASVRRLLLAVSYDKESEGLRYLLRPEESTCEHCLDLRLLISEPPVLSFDEDDEGRNVSQSLLEDLLLYLVVRRFGSSNLVGGKVILGVGQHTLVYWERRNVQQPTEIASLVETLLGLLLRSEWDAAGVSTLSRVVKRLQDPLVRQRFLAFSFQILRQSSQSKHSLPRMLEVDARFFDEVVRVLLLGVTDLWSTIRKDSAKTAADIAFEFTSQSHIEYFMDSLLCVAIGSRSVSADKSQVTAWTEREGALLALSVLLRSITTESTGKLPTAEKEPKISQVKDDIKGMLGIRQLPVVKYHLGSGRHTLTQLPRCLVQTLKPAIYQCIRHDQLSIRQLAAQCLVEYASLCEEPTRLLIFQEVISKLNRINRNEVASENASAENPNESELLDAFEAEGLLDVLARMAPRLPSTFLLKHWKFVFPTLEKYVMHIASSVRQKSSSVVLALAKESSSSLNQLSNPEIDDLGASTTSATNESSLELMVQMLCSLSKQRSDESSFCWQQKEGRLLSIDVLINVLGESLLSCGSDSCRLLRWKPDSTQIRQRNSGLVTDLQSFFWARNQAQAATWMIDTDEEEANGRMQNNSQNVSLIHAISIWIEKNSDGNDLPASRHKFWQQVISGCIVQTKKAFESSQFELRRISRQVLPGLMRLVIWTEQLEFLASTELKSVPAEVSWGWTCMKYILLHLRYLEESMPALDENQKVSTSQRLATTWKTVWHGILALFSTAKNLSVDTDAVVIQVEVKVMAFLCFGAATDSPRQVTRLFDGALRLIHKHLPETWQLRMLMEAETTVSSDNSLDRQFCMFLVPVLPAVVTLLQHVAGCGENSDASTNMSVETDLSSSSRWLCLERIALAWLSCDDMFRWITLSKSDAQSQILESLRTLLHSPNVGLSCVEERNEVDKIIQCLHDTFAASKGIRIKDTVYASLVDIYLQLWLRAINNGNLNSNKVVIAITQLYSERQHVLALPNASAKPVENTDSWDDDEDEVLQASPIGDIEEPQCSLTSDYLFQEALKSLDNSQLNVLREEVRGITDLVGERDIPTQHVARMQQQIDTCCTPNIL